MNRKSDEELEELEVAYKELDGWKMYQDTENDISYVMNPKTVNEAELQRAVDGGKEQQLEFFKKNLSTKAVPEGIRNVNKMIPSMEPYQESKALEKVIVARKELETRAEQEGDNDVEEEEDEVHDLRSSRAQATGSLLNGHGMNGHGRGQLHGTGSNNNIDKKRSSAFRAFWEGFKQSLNYGNSPAKTSRVVVMTIVLAVLGPTIARFRRQRR
ncbi:hypothetical protein EC991_003090 [Linnemannia zychae]|nr:hypothetical protein EC991_003090 [Linnemannia zychae]